MSKRLEEIKNEVAKEKGFSKWTPYPASIHIPDKLWPEICKRYATECCEATLKKASENVKLSYDDHGYPQFVNQPSLEKYIKAWDIKPNEESITYKDNIVLL